MEVFVDTVEAGATKYLYHYIPSQNGFEFISEVTITEKGWVAFEITGCSDYILSDTLLDESLVIETEAVTQPETPVVDAPVEEPAQQAGGMGTLPIIIVVAVIALAVVIMLIKKRKTE